MLLAGLRGGKLWGCGGVRQSKQCSIPPYFRVWCLLGCSLSAGPQFGNEKHEKGVKILCFHSPENTKEPSCATVGLSRLHVQEAEIFFGERDVATVTAVKIRGKKDGKEKACLEMPGIEPGTSYMQSMRSTAELHPLAGGVSVLLEVKFVNAELPWRAPSA